MVTGVSVEYSRRGITQMFREDEFVVKAMDWCSGEFNSSSERDFLYDLLEITSRFSVCK